MSAIHRYALSFARLALGGALGLMLGSTSMAQQATSQAASKPVWPNNGIAQRRFPDGFQMFVENDHGKLRAWVVSETGGLYVEALDFFTGQRMKVKVDREEDERQDQSFTDAKGGYHSSVGREFAFSATSFPITLPGISFDGDNIFLQHSPAYCSSSLISTTPTRNYITGQQPASNWNKFTIYHLVGVSQCPKGNYESGITSAVDLNDGTFLGIEGCFVFRLRKSDLSPVGLAPALRVLDKNTVQAAVDKAKSGGVQDVTDYVVKTLNLPTTPELSCKED